MPLLHRLSHPAARLLIAVLPWLPFASASAQGPAAPLPDVPIQAVRLQPNEKVRLDGRLDEAAWARAPAFERNFEIEPVRGRTPDYTTRVQVLYDDQALYVGVTALDPHPELIRAPIVRHDQVNRTQDFVVLYVDPIGARKSAQFFRVSASGSTGDGLHTAANDSEDFSPDFDFDSGAARNEHGYTVEFRIPYSTLRYTRRSGGWRIMVGRRIPRENVMLTLTVPLPQEALSFIDLMQPLDGFEPPKSANFLQVRPTVTLRRTDDRPYGDEREVHNEAKVSADVKWRPSPELVFDATLNPDFSQVALDTPQLSHNTRFALFLNEKRPFFLESTDLLVSPTDALYTRSVNDPRWGVRGTWRGESVTGVALGLSDKGGGSTLIPSAYGTDFALQPASKVLMSRAQAYVNDRLTLGGIVAARDYADGIGSNDVAGADAQWFLTDTWKLKGQLLRSRTTALPATDADGNTVLQPGPARDGGYAYFSLYGRTDRTETDLRYEEVTDGFRNDMGFVSQAGTRKVQGAQGLMWFELGPINQLEVNLNAQRVEERHSRQAVEQKWWPSVWLAAVHNTTALMEFVVDDKQRVRADTPLRDQRYVHAWVQWTPVTWIPMTTAWFDPGRYLDVDADRVVPGHRYGLDLQTRPFAWLELEPRVEGLSLANPVEGPYHEVVAQLLAIGYIAPQQSLRLILQRSSVQRGGAQPTSDVETAQSITYAWRKSAGTVLYVGATRGVVGLPTQPSTGTELFAKLQFDLDELRR